MLVCGYSTRRNPAAYRMRELQRTQQLRRLDEAAAGGDPDRLGAVVGAELGEDGADVELDGPLGDEEPFGDLPVSQPPRDEPEHLGLPRRQVFGGRTPVATGALQQPLRRGRPEQRAARVYGAHGGEDLPTRRPLEQVPSRPGPQCPQNALVRVVGGKDDGARGRTGVAQPLQGPDAVNVRHLEV